MLHNHYFKYYFEHFPAEHFSLLYLLNTIFCGFANYTTNPIFSYWIVAGDNTGEYNFKEGKSKAFQNQVRLQNAKFYESWNVHIVLDSEFALSWCPCQGELNLRKLQNLLSELGARSCLDGYKCPIHCISRYLFSAR